MTGDPPISKIVIFIVCGISLLQFPQNLHEVTLENRKKSILFYLMPADVDATELTSLFFESSRISGVTGVDPVRAQPKKCQRCSVRRGMTVPKIRSR